MPILSRECCEKLLDCKRAAMECLASCAPEELDDMERLLCIEVANCAEAIRNGFGVPAASAADPLDVDSPDCASEGGSAVYCP